MDTMFVNNAAHIAITMANDTKYTVAFINADIISDNLKFCVLNTFNNPENIWPA